jgi:DnaJ-class molecular chaperone
MNLDSWNRKTKALEILDISDTEELTESILKRQYRKMALIYHPDKNTSVDACIKFQEINDAYQFLLSKCDMESNIDVDETASFKESYGSLLFQFFKKCNQTYLSEVQNQIFNKILEKISGACKEKIVNIMEQLDKSILIKIYEIFKEHREVLHFSIEIIDEIGEILKRKIENTKTVILNPFLEDIMECNLYKLTMDDTKYIIPLWHHELIYDHSGNDLHIICNPILNDNMYIDIHNTIHINLHYDIMEIWNSLKEIGYFQFIMSKNTFFQIPANAFTMELKQTFIFNGKGIPKVNADDIYNVSKKGDIIIYLTIE